MVPIQQINALYMELAIDWMLYILNIYKNDELVKR